jgi:Flp pilus assembly protein CpaB
MRASTVFAIALSLLIALAAAAGAKYAGLFDRKAPPPPGEKPPPLKVLVATVNLYEDVTVMSDQVRVRDIQPEEERYLRDKYGESWQSKLMPALVTAAHLRVAKINIPADQILLKEYFTDTALPEGIPERLEKGMRAVNVSVPKDDAAGGVIRRGEYVDVLLTTKVWNASTEQEEIRTAVIARGLKVIMKRNNLWTTLAADPDDKPLHFTLQANPYRAALIKYAQSYGQLSLQPVPAPEKTPSGSFSDPNSKEYANEDQRVEEILRGELTIGDKDLVRIFQLPPPAIKPPPPQPTIVHHISGVADAGKTVFYSQANQVNGGASLPISNQPPAEPQPQGPVVPAGGMGAAPPSADGNYAFRMPSATGKSGSNCPTCDEQKRKMAEAARRAAMPTVGSSIRN